MKKDIFKILSISAVMIAALTNPTFAATPESVYPDKTIKILVGFPPGGLTDIMARLYAECLHEELKTTVIVENRPGASGQIASAQIARTEPDGYTLLMAATHHVMTPAINPNLPYDTVADFTPIAELAATPNVLLLHNDMSANNLQELIAYAEKEPDGLAFGSTSIGGSTHFSGELLTLSTKAPFFHVPFKGGAPLIVGLIGGQIKMAFVDMQGAAPFIRDNRVKAIAVTSSERSAIFPELPTISELGVPDFEVITFIGLYGPAGMSPELVGKLNKQAVACVNTPKAQNIFKNSGSTPGKRNEQEFKEYVNSEIAKWKLVAKERNITIEN